MGLNAPSHSPAATPRKPSAVSRRIGKQQSEITELFETILNVDDDTIFGVLDFFGLAPPKKKK